MDPSQQGRGNELGMVTCSKEIASEAVRGSERGRQCAHAGKQRGRGRQRGEVRRGEAAGAERADRVEALRRQGGRVARCARGRAACWAHGKPRRWCCASSFCEARARR